MTTAGGVVDELLGRFASASNLTLLARAADGTLVVYKPTLGVRPLWDFDAGTLAAREVLTYRVSQAMGLDLVPETSLAQGPLGTGVMQRFIHEDPKFDPLAAIEACDQRLWPTAVLDLVVNNADRKAGHLLAEAGTGRLWAIDHGLTFHPEPKLRTVLWGFAGRPLPRDMRTALSRLDRALSDGLAAVVEETLGPAEAAALRRRVRSLMRRPVHPPPPRHRQPVPWPPY